MCEGEPVRVSVCHCLECQRRSGSAFAAQARYPDEAVTITGAAKFWRTVRDSGNSAEFAFCDTCGSTVFYRNAGVPGHVAVPVGAFAEPNFPAPGFSVWEQRRHAWALIAGDDVQHED